MSFDSIFELVKARTFAIPLNLAVNQAVPSHFSKTKTKLSFSFVVASFATTVPSHFAKTKLNLSHRNT
jgi:hypothetical protein